MGPWSTGKCLVTFLTAVCVTVQISAGKLLPVVDVCQVQDILGCFSAKTFPLTKTKDYCREIERAEHCVEGVDLSSCTRSVRKDILSTLRGIRDRGPKCNIALCQINVPATVELSEGHTVYVELRCTKDPALYCDKDDAACTFDIVIHFSQISGTVPHCGSGAAIPQLVVGESAESTYVDGYWVIRVDSSNWNNKMTIPITAVVDGKIDGEQRWSVDFLMNKRISSQVIHSSKLSSFECTITDMDQLNAPTCAVITGSHLINFDYRYLNVFLEGEFVLVAHDSGSYEIHVWFQQCDIGGSCTCAVAVRAGDDVIVVDSCKRPDGTRRPLDNILYKNGELTPGTTLISESGGEIHKIILPSGTYILVEVTLKIYLNVWIRATPSDWSATSGLCGIYDGDPSNDLTLLNGDLFVPADNDEAVYPKVFSNSWRVAVEDTYIEGVAPSVSVRPLRTSCSSRSTFTSGEVIEDVCAEQLHISTCDISVNPELKTTDFVDAAIDSLVSRPKQQTVDVSNFPPWFDINYNPPIPSWPSNGWVQENATAFCQEYLFQHFAFSRLCRAAFPELGFEWVLWSCIEDIKVTGDTNWAISSLGSIRVTCEAARRSDVSSANDKEMSYHNPCASSPCGNNGLCEIIYTYEFHCLCFPPYTGRLCDVSLDVMPQVTAISGGNLCVNSIQAADCYWASIRGTDFVNNAGLSCRVRSLKLSSTGAWFPTNTFSSRLVRFWSFSKVECKVFLEQSSLEGFMVSVSNTGSIFSQEYFLCQYDSTCYDCQSTSLSQDVRCSLKPNTCDIESRCYKQGQAKSADEPFVQCQPSQKQFAWTYLPPPQTAPSGGETPCSLGQQCVNVLKGISRSSRTSVLCRGVEIARVCLDQHSPGCATGGKLVQKLSAYISSLDIDCQLPDFRAPDEKIKE